MEQLPAIITKARARLLVRAPFTGSIALGLAWVNAPDIGTMATDGRSIWFNPAWCEAHGVEKTMGVIARTICRSTANGRVRPKFVIGRLLSNSR